MRVLIVGLGNMGQSHALAHHHNPKSAICGLVNRSPRDLPPDLQGYPLLDSFDEGLALNPDLVVIATYSDSHADLAIRAMEAAAHVFVEKPLATSVQDADRVSAPTVTLASRIPVRCPARRVCLCPAGNGE